MLTHDSSGEDQESDNKDDTQKDIVQTPNGSI
jgi:hypothetical protein